MLLNVSVKSYALPSISELFYLKGSLTVKHNEVLYSKICHLWSLFKDGHLPCEATSRSLYFMSFLIFAFYVALPLQGHLLLRLLSFEKKTSGLTKQVLLYL